MLHVKVTLVLLISRGNTHESWRRLTPPEVAQPCQGPCAVGNWMTPRLETDTSPYTTDMPSPTILRAVVSRTQCDIAATELQSANVTSKQGSNLEYKLTPTCADIARHAHDVSISRSILQVRKKAEILRLMHLSSLVSRQVHVLPI